MGRAGLPEEQLATGHSGTPVDPEAAREEVKGWSAFGLQEGRPFGALSGAVEKVIQMLQPLPLGRAVGETIVEGWQHAPSTLQSLVRWLPTLL